jgi:hypothetical protein
MEEKKRKVTSQISKPKIVQSGHSPSSSSLSRERCRPICSISWGRFNPNLAPYAARHADFEFPAAGWLCDCSESRSAKDTSTFLSADPSTHKAKRRRHSRGAFPFPTLDACFSRVQFTAFFMSKRSSMYYILHMPKVFPMNRASRGLPGHALAFRCLYVLWSGGSRKKRCLSWY